MEERKLEGMRYSRRVCFSNLDLDASWGRVKDFANTAGRVMHVDMVKDERGKFKGTAIVEFECQLEALRALQQLEGVEFLGHKVSLREEAELARSRSPTRKREASPRREDGWQVYISNLHYSITWQQLKEEFRSYGTILRVDIPKTREGRSRGYGFITFERQEEAEHAVEKMHDKELSGRKLTVKLQTRRSR